MSDLQDALRALKKRDVDTFPATVLEVDKTARTCKVTDGEIEFSDVQLSSVIDQSNQKFILFPKIDSSVLISPINEDLHRMYVEAYSEIESLVLVIEQTELKVDKVGFLTQTEKVKFQIDKDGFLLKKENETLKGLISDLIKEIKLMKFTTNNGPTIKLINAPKFTEIENRFNQFLKSN